MEPFSFVQANNEGMSAAVAGAFTAADGIIAIAMLLLIGFIVWLSHRELKISHQNRQSSERMLETERDMLERRISERTAAFVRAEEQRMIELQRNAEFGKLSQGLFHDLMSPLSSISLYVKEKGDQEGIRGMIDASRRLNSFMESVKRTFGQESAPLAGADVAADLETEISIVRDILGYKARMAVVKIGVEMEHGREDQAEPPIHRPIRLPIHPVRLHQLILNLVSNAIDACADSPVPSGKSEHVVTISAARKELGPAAEIGARSKTEEAMAQAVVELSVSDTGCGISPENKSRMFKESFTTKKGGTGIGLMTIKTIVEKDLRGTIAVESEEGRGARFVVTISINK